MSYFQMFFYNLQKCKILTYIFSIEVGIYNTIHHSDNIPWKIYSYLKKINHFGSGKISKNLKKGK